jgi:uncharacterized repeat protein (TIGR03837 family)
MWDVFCRVIDNHGDLGVCLRLARQLAQRGISVRLWVDDDSALDWMAPDVAHGSLPGVTVLDWSGACEADGLRSLPRSEVWVEAFGCELPEAFVAHGVHWSHEKRVPPPRWINLEYLSAESYVERVHRLPSPVMSGPAQGWVKHFFYPGFTPATGGLLREADLMDQQAAFDRDCYREKLWPGLVPEARLISLFCYEPVALTSFLTQRPKTDHVLVTPGRALAAVRKAQSQARGWQPVPHTDQAGFDRLLWACDLNLVRGEDSLVRALWASRPLVWQIYPQEDQAHLAKLQAFLDWLDAPSSLRHFHAIWNGIEHGTLPELTSTTLTTWAECVSEARKKLWAQPDLLTQLIDFVSPAA